MKKLAFFLLFILFVYLKIGIVKGHDEFGSYNQLFIKENISFQFIFYNPIGERDIEDLDSIQFEKYKQYCIAAYSPEERQNKKHVCYLNSIN